VTVAYLDTSAAMKLVIEEPQSDALVAELLARDDRQIISSWLLHAELHCAAGGRSDDVELGAGHLRRSAC